MGEAGGDDRFQSSQPEAVAAMAGDLEIPRGENPAVPGADVDVI